MYLKPSRSFHLLPFAITLSATCVNCFGAGEQYPAHGRSPQSSFNNAQPHDHGPSREQSSTGLSWSKLPSISELPEENLENQGKSISTRPSFKLRKQGSLLQNLSVRFSKSLLINDFLVPERERHAAEKTVHMFKGPAHFYHLPADSNFVQRLQKNNKGETSAFSVVHPKMIDDFLAERRGPPHWENWEGNRRGMLRLPGAHVMIKHPAPPPAPPPTPPPHVRRKSRAGKRASQATSRTQQQQPPANFVPTKSLAHAEAVAEALRTGKFKLSDNTPATSNE